MSNKIKSDKVKEEVNHPQHYNRGNIEAIEYIKDLGLLEGFCLGNAIKYLARCRDKGSLIKDLEKTIWYLEYYRNYLLEEKKVEE